MYYPYLRGKQYELITVRENAHRMGTNIIPIIEPVKESLQSLSRALQELIDNDCRFIVVANPRCGDFETNQRPLHAELRKTYLANYADWSVGCIADDRTTARELQLLASLRDNLTIIHNGYPSGSELSNRLNDAVNVERHVFIEKSSSRLYRRHFRQGDRVLIRDGFTVRTNREHPDVEHFSDLHITFRDERLNGFGDFLIVGADYSETGGPAYAVAIHLTFVNPEEDDDMFVKHYVSDRQTSPVDPGGKFAEALVKLVADVTSPHCFICRTEAVNEFIELHRRGHYPGLGYVKKLSMQHHIELIADFLGRDE
jgi:hypothetical protein